MRTVLSFILTFSVGATLLAQESDTLTTRYKVLAKGNLYITGNNILNRQEGKKLSANKANDDTTTGMKVNDNQTMEYIDIDKDKNTFSSSAANVLLPKNSKILFAGLYWSATYPFERGELKAGKVVISDAKREPVEEVLLKLPKGKYTSVKGQFVFDGSTDSRFIDKNAPYVMFADVTKLLQEAKRLDGEYTVANIRSAKGMITGGACAGWALVIAYENPQEPFRKIDIKDGFLAVKESKDVIFTNFKIPSVKEVFPRLIGAALDADIDQGENKMGIFSQKVGIYMETRTRKVKNFLNSSITYGEDIIKERKPNSKNTLGVDIFSVEVPNYDFEVFPVGGDFLRVNFSSTHDEFYTYLLGLAIHTEEGTSLRDEEVDRILGKKPTPKPVTNQAQTPVSTQEKQPVSTAVQPKTTLQPKTEVAQAGIAKVTNTQNSISKPVQQQPSSQSVSEKVEIPSNVYKIKVDNVKKGCYLILGAYSSKENVDKYIFNLRQKGMHAEGSFFYPVKNLHYAYSYYLPTYEEALKKQREVNTLKKANPALEKVKDVWILIVE